MDDDERAMIEEGNAPAVSVEEPLPPRPQDAQVRVEEEDEEPMRIVKDYQRPTAKYALHLRSLFCSSLALWIGAILEFSAICLVLAQRKE